MKKIEKIQVNDYGTFSTLYLNADGQTVATVNKFIADLNSTPSTPVKETEQFFNGDLQMDAEKHLRTDNFEIKKDEAENDGELMYYLDVNDDSYFYHNESDRDFDYARAKRLFTKKPAPTPTSKEGLEDGGFTKGEWVIESTPNDGDTSHIICSEDKETTIAGIYKWPVEGYHKEAEANARLIAAAPAMFEALKDCLKCLTMDSDMDEVFAPEIKKAIAILTSINKD
ncbi:MAG: hypothetical protein KBA90_14360 [Chitinophagaceae bacterium]|nr:hypothetical protein [Chitinophagaceae bacterium]